MAQIVPFPLDKVRKSKKENIFEEKHILHMIKNIRQNYPPSLWNTVYQLTTIFESLLDTKSSKKLATNWSSTKISAS